MGSLAEASDARMPPEGLGGRGHEILDVARDVFAKKGFNGASMQDLARAAGMSVGNFYRYFASKTAMIHAMVARDVQQVEAQFHDLTLARDPLEAMRAAIHFHVIDPRGLCANAPIWAEMTAAAHRDADLAQLICEAETEITSYLLQAIALASGRDLADVAEQNTAHARLLILICKTASFHDHLLPEDQRAGLKSLILTQIDRILSEIIPVNAKELSR